MIIENVTFDNFLTLSLDDQNKILNDPELIKELVKKNIGEHRYNHSLSVAKVAKELAIKHNVDDSKAYMAGLLHDVCKFPDSDTSGILEKYLKKYDPSKLNGHYGAYHSWVAKYYLIEKCNYQDEDILDAIYNHTFLEHKNDLNVILYISDKREPLRNINDDILELAYDNLDIAYKKLVDNVNEYVRSRGEEPFNMVR